MILQIEPWIDEAEGEQFKRILQTTYVTEGPLTEEFEEKMRALTGAKHAMAYANGTVSEFAILRALGIGAGDEVIVPDTTFIASANAVLLAGARPVFADVCEPSLGITAATVEPLITSRTKAILPVHLYGGMADMEELSNLARARNLHLVEDAAEAIGVRHNGRHAGTMGTAGFLSFYGNKTMTTAEGGVILTDDPQISQACYRLKNHGRDRKGIYIHDHIGFNFAFTDLQAALGIAQLGKLEEIIRRKLALCERYRKLIAPREGLSFQSWLPGVSPVPWFINIFVPDAEGLQAFLAEREIQSRRFFYPMHLQPCYTDQVGRLGDYPVARKLYEQGLSLPSSAIIAASDVEKVAESINEYFRRNDR